MAGYRSDLFCIMNVCFLVLQLNWWCRSYLCDYCLFIYAAVASNDDDEEDSEKEDSDGKSSEEDEGDISEGDEEDGNISGEETPAAADTPTGNT